ncbi:MAG: exopolysaccharide Pel transporter PelG [Elusimicrobia bacterium]|nr:exopolysaccharide Pel transporter PelG [Elusimicrobiota bacterium]
MAGVGLELQRLSRRPSYLTVLRVFGYSLALSVGPWLATIFAVAFVSIIGLRWLGLPDMVFFTSTVMYVFAGSLVATGPLFMIFSRYLADRGFHGRLDQRRALIFVEWIVVPASLAAGAAAVAYFLPSRLGNSLLYQAAVDVLFASLTGLWCVLAYLDFQKRYAVSFYVFTGGCAGSALFAFVLKGHGLDGLMAGYAGGFLVAFVLLFFLALKRPEKAGVPDTFQPLALLSYARDFAPLAWIGLLYNLGTWIDKFVLWKMAGHVVPGSQLRIFPPYDISTFLSYLIMMPGISYFLVMVETRFYFDYRAYLDDLEQSSLRAVDERRTELWRNLKRQMNNLFELELVTGLLGLIIGGFFLQRLGLEDATLRIFRVLIGAAFFQVLFWIHLILLLYFEFRAQAVAMAALFLASNAAFTWLNAARWAGFGYGWGYLASIALCTAASWWMLRGGIRNLNRHIFFINSNAKAR